MSDHWWGCAPNDSNHDYGAFDWYRYWYRQLANNMSYDQFREPIRYDVIYLLHLTCCMKFAMGYHIICFM